jgi:hypothetical protein
MAAIFKFVVFLGLLTLGEAILEYLPHLHETEDRQTLVEHYFNLGLQYSEIIAFISSLHGIQLSLRQLKRILKNRGLRRRKDHASIEEIAFVIEEELTSTGACIGYRQMHQKLRIQHGIVTNRETVRLVLKELDPVGVEVRSRRKLRRRKYSAQGPNFNFYDKLKPFGICIHGAIDGFSRRIMWLEAGPSNNDPKITSKYFLDCVRQLGGAPKFVRTDRGTENIYIAGIQRFLRRNCADVIDGGECFLYGKSVSNQRIEAWWSFLRKSYSSWWMNVFKDMRDSGTFDDSDPVQAECLRFSFMRLIQNELNNVAKCWNLHRIRRSSNTESLPGKPDVLYHLPEQFGRRNCIKDIDVNDLDIAEEYAEQRPAMGCDESFAELASMIMEDPIIQCLVMKGKRTRYMSI